MIKSDEYYHRKRILKTLEVPTISEIKESLKEPLADLFFKSCPEELKPIIGLAPPLDGPGNTLWVSPSDLLTGIVKLKPPLTCKHIAALTHQGILEIGKVIEDRFIKQWEIEKKKELDEQEEILLFKAARDKQLAIELTIDKQEKQCARTIQSLINDYELKILRIVKSIQKRSKEHCEEMMNQQKEDMDAEWAERLRETVEETVLQLTEQFLQEMQLQEQQLAEHCERKLQRLKEKAIGAIEEERAKCHETFQQLRHQLECRNMANLMYVLAMERRKCKQAKENLEMGSRQRIIDLENAQAANTSKILKLEEETKRNMEQINLREECLLEILRQFQKFINFALKAVPTQAEFLLDVNQLTLYELKKAIQETDIKRATRIARGIRKWNSDVVPVDNLNACVGLTLRDHHGCNNEVDLPEDNASLGDNDDLPAFVFNKDLYVREDFRNMVSQGIEVSRNSMLWSKNVEHLVNILKNDPLERASLNELSRNASVRFSADNEEVTFAAPPASNVSENENKGPQMKPALVKSVENVVPPNKGELTANINILGSRDSVEKIKCGKTAPGDIPSININVGESVLPNVTSEKELDTNVRNGSKVSIGRVSLSKGTCPTLQEAGVQTSRMPSQLSVLKKDQERNRKNSKLSMARDSFEIICKSIHSLASARSSKKSENIEDGKAESSDTSSDIIKNNEDTISGKSVRLSYIEVVHIPEKHSMPPAPATVVSAKHRGSHRISATTPLPWKIYEYTSVDSTGMRQSSNVSDTPKPEKVKKPKPKPKPLPNVKIAGERGGVEHLQTHEEFTLCRVDSMLGILNKSPSLRRIFTSITK